MKIIIVTMLQIHQKIKQARRSANLTQQQIADKIGIERSTYQYWEKADPSIENIKAVVKALKLPNDYFFIQKDEREKNLNEPGSSYDDGEKAKMSKKNPEESEESYRVKYMKKLEEDNELLKEILKANQEIIKINLTLVLSTVRTISVRQEATGGVVLESLARLEKKSTNSLIVEGDKRRDRIEREAHKHGTPSSENM